MVTHDPQDALIFADQAILVADGYASAPQPIQEFFDDPPRALKAYLETAHNKNIPLRKGVVIIEQRDKLNLFDL